MTPENLSVLGTAMANHLWQSTLFAILVAILTLVLRKNQARVRHHLWLTASLKFLVPFSLMMNFGSYLARLNGSTESQPGFYFVVQKVSQPFNQTPDSNAWLAAYLLRWLPGMLGVVWVVGFVTVMSLWWLRWRRVAATVLDAVPMTGGREVEALRRVENATGMHKPLAFWSSQSSLEPGVFGIVRPILLWPSGISKHLQEAHLVAILAHEVQHVKRRDNLAAAMHMVVEAIFWFHPLVWWLGARLVEERERACDEEVLLLGNPPQIYAESILKTCEFCMEPPVACVSGVTGADLKHRIIRIMTQRSGEDLSMGRKFLLFGAACGAVTVPVIAGLVKAPVMNAQSPQVSVGVRTAAIQSAQQIASGPIQNGSNNFTAPQQPYHVGGEVSVPKLVYAPDPEFTEKAKQANYEGTCVVSLIVDARGKPQHVKVVRHLEMGLDKKAVEAVKEYRFEPAMLHEKPVAVEVKVEIHFRRY